MDENKAAPTVGAAEAEAKGTNRVEHTERTKSIPQSKAAIQAKILKNLRSGRKNATSSYSLAGIVETNERTLRQGIEYLRLAGVLIMSDDTGYWMFDREEQDAMLQLRKFIRRDEKHAKSIFRRMKKARQLLREMERERDAAQ